MKVAILFDKGMFKPLNILDIGELIYCEAYLIFYLRGSSLWD